LERSSIVLTDSGGIQEEAPSFGVPVLVLRDLTERMEAVDAGIATLVGTDPDKMVEEARRRLAAGKLSSQENPFGDGKAAERCVDAMVERFAKES
jgi:UDP-N-acetylglucosamine 2-epimerase (non-hydrolysing)